MLQSVTSWLSRLTTKSLAAPDAELLALFGAAVPTAAGVSVSAATALRCTPVACAVRVITEAVATLPIMIYRRTADAKERATEHPAYRLLHDDPNDWTSAFALKQQVTSDALLNDKGGFALVVRNGDGKPMELHRLDPAKVTVSYNAMSEPAYSFGGEALRRSDVLHIRPLGLGGLCALSAAREAVGLAIVLEGHGSRLFGNGARPSGVLSLKDRVTPEAVKKVRDAWQAAHGGGRSGGTAIVEGGAEYTPLTLTSVDAQYLELRAFQIAEIARAFRVPPHMLYELDRATWSNIGDMGREFLTYSLLPWLEEWQGAIRRTLLTEDERPTHVVEFLVDDLLRADLAARATAYSTLIAARVLNPNEARAMENRAPYAGGDAFVNPNISTGGAAE